MPDPYNYQLNVPNPASAVLAGLEMGDAFRQKRAATDLEAAKASAVNQQAVRQASFQKDIAGLGEKPTAAGIASIAGKYPEFIAHTKETFDLLDKNEKQTRLDQGAAVYSALSAGDSKYAINLLNGYADAYTNANQPDRAKQLLDLAKLTELHPEIAQTTAGAYLAGAMGPDKFTEAFSSLEKNRRETAAEGATLTKAQAEAHQAQVKSNWAESAAVQEYESKGFDMAKVAADTQFVKANTKLAAIKVAIDKSNSDNEKQKLQLELDKYTQQRDDDVRAKLAQATDLRTSIDNNLNNIQQIIDTPIGIIHDAAGLLNSKTPTFNNSVGDFEEKLKTTQAQLLTQALAMAKANSTNGASGFGSLNKEEGEALQKSIGNLSLRQSGDSLVKNAKEVQRIMLKYRKNITARFGIPETVPDTPSAIPTAAEGDQLLQRNRTQ